MQHSSIEDQVLEETASSILKKTSRWLWGYDFFISYHWQSGGRYAVRLAEQLRQRGFDVFLDQSEFISGDNWEQEADLALKSTQRLIVIATCEAVTQSLPVAKEIQHFKDRSQHIIPVVFISDDKQPLTYADNQALSLAARNNTLLSDTRIFVSEAVNNLNRGPTESTLLELSRTKGMMKRRTLRYSIVATTIVVLLIAALILGLLGVFANAQMRVAERRFVNLQSLTESTVTELHDIVQELPGALRHRELLVASSLPYLDNLLAEKPEDESTLHSLAIGYLRLGDVLGHPESFSLGKTDEALASWEKANAVTSQLIQKDPKQTDYELLRGNLAIRFSLMELKAGEHQQAVTRLIDAEKRFVQFTSQLDSAWEFQLFHAQLLMRKGDIELSQGLATEAHSSFENACQLADAALEHDDTNRLIYFDLASCRERIAGLKRDAGELTEASGIVDSAIELRELLENEEPYNAINLSRLSSLYVIRGDIERSQLKTAESLSSYQLAVNARRRLYSTEPENISFIHSLATDLERLALAFESTGAIEKSLESNEESLELRERLVNLDPDNEDYLYHKAIALERMADTLKNHFELTADNHRMEVEERYRAAMSIRGDLMAGSPEYLEYRKAFASSELTLGRYLFEYTDALAEAKELLGSASKQFKNLLTEFPDVVQLHKGAIKSFSLYGQVLENGSIDYEGALNSKKASVVFSEHAVRRFPEQFDLLKTNLVAQYSLANTLFDASEKRIESLLQEALLNYKKTMAVAEKLRAHDLTVDGLAELESEVSERLHEIRGLLGELR